MYSVFHLYENFHFAVSPKEISLAKLLDSFFFKIMQQILKIPSHRNFSSKSNQRYRYFRSFLKHNQPLAALTSATLSKRINIYFKMIEGGLNPEVPRFSE